MSRQLRVGILVFAGLALFLVALFAIASRSFLFSNTFPLEAEFENVAGLQAGAPVQYQGASVGRVERVALPAQIGQSFTVEMAIRDDAQHLVSQRTIAQIKSQSLVGGNMMIVLVNPSLADQTGPDDPADLEPVEPGTRIRGQEPFSISETSDQLLATVDTFANVAVEMQQIMQDVQRGEGSLGRFIYDDALYDRSVATIEQAEATAAETQQLMSNLSASTERITASAEDATAGFQAIFNKINRGEGTLGRLLNDEGAYNRFLAAADTLVASTSRLEDVLANAESATQWASLGAYRFSENMEALKHNFLFKPYFEERGYMEKADFEIRESAIEATYQDLETWQRELNEREARLDERETRLDAPETPAGPSAQNTTAPSAPAEAAPDGRARENASPADASPADASPADASPADASPADASPADASPADASPADASPETRPAEQTASRTPAGGGANAPGAGNTPATASPQPVEGAAPLRLPKRLAPPPALHR